jgi:hypothetical protein
MFLPMFFLPPNNKGIVSPDCFNVAYFGKAQNTPQSLVSNIEQNGNE